MKFKYVNPKAVDHVVGRYAPVGSFALARIIEEALENTNLGFVHTEAGRGRFKSDDPVVSGALAGVADRLLAHNLSTANRKLWEFYSGLDFDLVHESSPALARNGKSVNTSVKAYFHQVEFGRPLAERRVVFHLDYSDPSGTRWSISFPVQVVMKGYPSIENGYVGYCHGITLSDQEGKLSSTQHNYVGITKRNWLERMSEHFAEIRRGSNKTFHAAWRQYVGRKDVQLTSELVVTNHTFEQIMSWEEWAVDREMAKGTSLNMIPGGFKGMKFLHEHRLTYSAVATLEERDAAIVNFQALNPRAGIPNLLISELWKDPEYAEQVICGAEGRLTADQVRKIRELNGLGIAIERMVALVGARNQLQVERVLSGQTYSRIH